MGSFAQYEGPESHICTVTWGTSPGRGGRFGVQMVFQLDRGMKTIEIKKGGRGRIMGII